MSRVVGGHDPSWLTRLITTLALTLVPPEVAAQSNAPVRGEPVVRRLFVPANQPEHWPTGPWEPWSAERVAQALRAVRRVRSWSTTPPLAEARYEATLLGDSLTDGRLLWTFQDRDGEPRFVELEPCELVLQNLAWGDRIPPFRKDPGSGLAWGRTSLGRLGFCSPGGRRADAPGRSSDRYQIVGEWALDGERFGAALVFSLVLPPAHVNRLELRVPQGLRVTSSEGHCRLSGETGPPGWSLWEIDLGQYHECRLRVAPAPGARESVPRLTARPDISFTVRPEATRVRAMFEFAAWEGEVDSVEVAVPEEMRIANVLYGDLPTSWNGVPGQPGRLMIPLPEKVQGPLRRIELRGLLPGSLNQTWRMPPLGTPGALELEGHLGVRLQGAQPVSSLSYSGLRQFGHDPSPQDGEVFEFRRLRPDATLELSPVEDPLRMSFQSFSILDSGPPWQAECHLVWTLGEGSSWSVACQVPAEWEVLEVRGDDGAGDDEGRSIDWTLVAQGAWQQVVVELSERVDSEHPVRLQMTLRGPGNGLVGSVPLPLVRPVDGRAVEQLTVFSGWSPTHVDWDEGCRMTEVSRTDLVAKIPESWKSTSILAELSRKADQSPSLWMVVCEGDSRGHLALPSPPPSLPNESLTTSLPEGLRDTREVGSGDQSAWISEARARVRLSAGGDQVDEYELTWLIPARKIGWELSWSFPPSAEDPRVSVDGVIGTPIDHSGGFRQGVVLPAKQSGDTAQLVVVRYRHDDGIRTGLHHRQLALPVPDLPVLKTYLELHLPPNLVLATPPAEFLATTLEVEPGSKGWWRSVVEPRFNPWVADNWWRLLQGTKDGPAEDPTPEFWWRGEAAGAPMRVTLTTWNRTEARGLGWCACLASLAVGLGLRRVGPGRASHGIAGILGLLGATALVTPPLVWPLLQTATLGCLISLVVPEAWLACSTPGRDRLTLLTPLGDSAHLGRSSRTLGAVLGLWLCLASGARSQSEGLPRALLGPLESLGDILIPVDLGGVAGDRLYVSPEFRGNVAEPLRQVSLPKWLGQETTLQSLPAGPMGDLLEARLRGVRVGTEPVEIPLQLSGLTLADEVSCLVNGQPHEVWRTDSSGGLVISLAENEHLGSTLGAEPRPPLVPLPDETACTNICTPDSTIDLLTELEIVLRLLPIPDETLRRARRVTLPAAAVTRLRLPGDPQRGHWTLFQPAATYHPPPRVGLPEELGVQASELQWQTAPGDPQLRQEPIRVESWNLVDFDGQANTTRCWARYLAGGTPVQSIRWIIPEGMTVRQIEGPPLSGETWELLEGGDRRLCLEFAEAQTQTFEVLLDLIRPAEANPLELRFPDPADNTVPSRLRFDLRQDRVALRTHPDRQLTVSSPVIDQPLRALSQAELSREPRFGELSPDLGFELDRPLALMVLVQAGDRPLQAATVEQRGEIRHGRLVWNYRATDVRSNQSVFHYELLVDPRVEINEVRVWEQQSDRVARWSREGDRLTVFLASRAGTTQTLDVTGSLLLPETGEVAPPRITLRGLRPTIERRLLTVVDASVTARLTHGDAPGQAPGGSLLLIDAPSNPEEEWPTLRLTGQRPREADRPDAPKTPDAEADAPETPAATATVSVVVPHAELELSAPHRAPWTCLVRLWLSPGESETLNWTVPNGAVARGLQWNGLPLKWQEKSSQSESKWECVVPSRNHEGLLQAVWQLPNAEPNGVMPLWPHLLPEIPRVTNVKSARLALIWNFSEGTWLSIAPPWREETRNGLNELRSSLSAKVTESLPSQRIAVGSDRVIEEWRNGGTIPGLKVWPGHLVRSGFMGVAILSLAWLVWWLTPLWKFLQRRGSLTLVVVGLIWWGWFVGGGWGLILAIVSFPRAFWDLRTAIHRPTGVRA